MVAKNNVQMRGLTLQPLAILRGVLCSFFLLIVISIVLAVVVYFSSWQPTPQLLAVLAHVAMFAGALWAGRSCKQNAWLHGILVGLVAFIVLSYMGYGEALFVIWLWWKRLFRAILVSMLGGIVGGLFNGQ